MDITNNHTFQAIAVSDFLKTLRKEWGFELVCSMHGKDPLYFDDLITLKQNEIQASFEKGEKNLFAWITDLDRDKLCWLAAYFELRLT